MGVMAFVCLKFFVIQFKMMVFMFLIGCDQ